MTVVVNFASIGTSTIPPHTVSVPVKAAWSPATILAFVPPVHWAARDHIPILEANRMSAESSSIESTSTENRIFNPPAAFSAKAHIKSREQYDRMYRESIDSPDAFWGREAKT